MGFRVLVVVMRIGVLSDTHDRLATLRAARVDLDSNEAELIEIPT